MNKPIRCTTHFHACDCREYGFQLINDENKNLKVWVKHHQASAQNAINEKSELMKKMQEKDAEIEKLQKENQEMREALGKAVKNLSSVLHFLHSTGWQHYDVEKPEFQCHYLLSETIFTLHNINLSETPNSSKEGV